MSHFSRRTSKIFIRSCAFAICVFCLRNYAKELGHYGEDMRGMITRNGDDDDSGHTDISAAAAHKGSAGTCPPGFLYLEDSVIPESITHANTKIPRVIHLIVRDRCAPNDISDHLREWRKVSGRHHSIIFHDQKNIDNYLSKDREDLPFISNAAKCTVESVAKSDLAKFLIMWDFGGIVVDIENVPGPSFVNGTSDGIISAEDECVVDFVPQYSDDSPSPPRFFGCVQKHYLLYALIYMSISNHFLLFNDGNFLNQTYANQRGEVFQHILRNEFHHVRDSNDGDGVDDYYKYDDGDGKREEPVKRKATTIAKEDILTPQSVIMINSMQLPYPFLTNLSISNSTRFALQIMPSSMEDCVNWNRNSPTSNVESLLKLVGNNDENMETCHGNLTLIRDSLTPDSFKNMGRKIPKTVHMTSRSRCVTDTFAKNIGLWYFDDHSFFMHDDSAVNRLLDTVFREFPLLKDAKHCVASGAGLADLWRYVLLWEYGGLYTDIDNAPGIYFGNGTIIENSTDFLVEQERGGYPSQYFIAASPKHPASYFMTQLTIHRLLKVSIIANQFTAQVTGPGAAKCGVISFIGGNGYQAKGDYVGLYNRSMTIIGSPFHARKGKFIRRDSVKGKVEELSKMNITHFNVVTEKAMRRKTGIRHSCLVEIYRRRHSNHLEED